MNLPEHHQNLEDIKGILRETLSRLDDLTGVLCGQQTSPTSGPQEKPSPPGLLSLLERDEKDLRALACLVLELSRNLGQVLLENAQDRVAGNPYPTSPRLRPSTSPDAPLDLPENFYVQEGPARAHR